MWNSLLILLLGTVLGSTVLGGTAQAGSAPASTAPLSERPSGTVIAEVVALDTPLLYNRFGSLNPFGMVYALAGDIEPQPGGRWTLEGLSCAAAWRFRSGVRPRPLVLRGNVGDVLEVRFQNRLGPQPDLSRCRAAPDSPYRHLTRPPAPEAPENLRADAGPLGGPADWPRTRSANLFIPGVRVLPSGNAATDAICRGLRSVARGAGVTCRFALERPGTHLFSSTAAPVGGEGDGGSLTHGLFGALHVERQGSLYLRSQVTPQLLDAAWPRTAGGGRQPLNYRALDLLSPLGGSLYRLNGADLHAVIWEPPPTAAEVQVSDADVLAQAKKNPAYGGTPAQKAALLVTTRQALHAHALAQARAEHALAPAFREFTAIFHDELKTYYAEPFRSLGENEQLTGVKDGFGLNYGASGMGSILLANRLGIGPAADCVECLYEEFFLQSWANGDPALLEAYRRDPSNVFHSYLNDRVAFRNLHAGPKETHVFHLHAHQWLSASDEDRGSYLDSQTIAPMQGFQYQIYGGGLKLHARGDMSAAEHTKGDHEHTRGSGNRNRTVGDSIFHCHLYPHFAQGMWALWRVHDVLEDGTRTLPDGQPRPGLSLRRQSGPARPGTDPATGRAGAGTPVPGVVPLPAQALPPAPTYGERGLPGYPYFIAGVPGHRAPQPPLDLADSAGLPRHVVLSGERKIAAAPAGAAHAGHSPAEAHATVQRSLALADFTAHLESLRLRLLPPGGTPLERRAMQFHAGQFGKEPLTDDGQEVKRGPDGQPLYGVVRDAQTGRQVMQTRTAGLTQEGYQGYDSSKPDGTPALFTVNGSPPQPGAPFADPCGAPRDGQNTRLGGYIGDPELKGFRRYDVSAIQLDLVVNKEGWHDPQGRINVLSGTPNASLDDKAAYFSNAVKKEGRASTKEDPFFFRAQSGECVTYYHSNRIPKDLERDDFQMRTPTDIIGQHIHLVKFDVTSSDGAGNGWNYEDGTLAPDAVLERKCAYNAWLKSQGQGARFTDPSTRYCGRAFPEFGTPAFAALPVQTTVQRWFADPIVTVGRTLAAPSVSMPGMSHPTPESVKKDRTLRTVFTHDHFAPSSIQQHGFYSALLIEPFVRRDDPQLADAWLRPDGSPLADAQGQAVGWQAILRNAQDRVGHRDQREFALAVADFALLYDPRPFRPAPLTGPQLQGRAGMDRLLAEARLAQTPFWRALVAQGKVSGAASALKPADVQALKTWAEAWWKLQGRPVDPPPAPEAISTAHHNPFLVNYRHEPIPLRLGVNTHADSQPCGAGYLDNSRVGQPYLSTGRVRIIPQGSVNAPRRDRPAGDLSGLTRGDPAGLFLSSLHGEPCTPLLRAYEGERASFRLVQGAQEVQHVFTVEGLSWKRMPDYETQGTAPHHEVAAGRGTWPFGVAWKRDNPLGLSNAQEVGISEHFEAELTNLPNVQGAGRPLDRLYHFGTQDALWNGAWGLLRVLNGAQAGLAPVEARGTGGVNIVNRFEVFPAAPSNPSPPASLPYTDADGRRLTDIDAVTAGSCPVAGGTTRVLRFAAVATRVDLLRPGGLVYDPASDIRDPDALILLPLTPSELASVSSEDELGAVVNYAEVMALLRARYATGRLQPFVLRATAGDCVELTVYNALKAPGEAGLPDRRGDAPMPPIVPLNVGTHPSDPAQRLGPNCPAGPRTGECARDLPPSASLALTVPLVAMNQGLAGNSLPVGGNPASLAAPPAADGKLSAHRSLFYAGEVTYDPVAGSPRDVRVRVRPYDFGPLPLRAYSDVIGQGSHGLFGVVVIEPRGARVMRSSPVNPARVTVVRPQDWHTLGLSAFVCTTSQRACQGDTRASNGFQEHVLVYQDGLNLWWRGQPVGHCTVCDDSYDLGDRAFSYASAPLWARLRQGFGAQDTRPGTDLNRALFPQTVLTPAYASVPTPTLRAMAGQDVRMRVLQVDGRARQHAFVLSGFGYEDQLLDFGSPNSGLIAPGKAFTARLEGSEKAASAGCYLYRDGPTMFMGAGMWGHLDMRSGAAPGVSRC